MLDGEGKYLQSLFPLCVLALIESEVDDRICANSQTSAVWRLCVAKSAAAAAAPVEATQSRLCHAIAMHRRRAYCGIDIVSLRTRSLERART